MSRRLCGTILLVTIALLATACATGGARRSASVVDYLYPNEEQRVVQPSLPVLTLPLKVGIAFVPAGDGRFDFTSIPEADRQQLLEKVSERFRQEAFVKDIQTIPTTYLQPRGGFTNLEQVAKLLDVDVIALLSYDQTQFTGSTKASLLYWTLAGAYLVEGEKNDTRTLLDAAVFDVKSHKLLFRAPGTSTVKSSSSLSDVARDRRGDAAKGFQLASTELVTNLEREL
ncbi:MAG TPA: rhombotarget lipoprotein, partial [Gemmatimonadaceae bacterium]|nr:rhombotarget lipoprotein [Gemmatimonadaceae bacterium]